MKKNIIIGLFIIVIAGFFGYNYVMAAPKNIQSSKVDFTLKSSNFLAEFTKNMRDAEKKYTDKVIAIEGSITEVEDKGVTIDNKVFCQLATTTNLKAGQKLKVKGLFIGYDELFELVKLDQGSVISSK